MKKLAFITFTTIVLVACSGKAEKKSDKNKTDNDSKMEALSRDLADDVCKCMDMAETKTDVIECQNIIKIDKYKDYDKEQVPQDVRAELKAKVKGCVQEARKRIEG